jgi:hypothetical protein
MPDAKRMTGRTLVLLAVGLPLFLAIDSYATYTFLTSRILGANDFYARWQPLRAWLTKGSDPYAKSVTVETEIGMYGHPAGPDDDLAMFDYPLYSVLFFGLTALIAPYAWASAVWIAILQVCLLALAALSLAWSQWRPPPLLFGLTILFSILWYHSVRTLLLGQFAGVEALLLTAAVLAARAGRDAWAGLLLALATTKPQMAVLLIPAVLLWAAWHQRWALIGWFAGVLALLCGISFLLLPSWLLEWLGQINGYVGNTGIPGPVAILTAALLPGTGHWVEYGLDSLLIIYLIWAWYQARQDAGRRLDWAVALTLVVTNLIALRTATTNYVMMLPALFLLFALAQQHWGRRGQTVIVFVEAVLLVGLWTLFAVTVQGTAEQPAMYLPLPIFLLVGLALARRAWLNQPQPLAMA